MLFNINLVFSILSIPLCNLKSGALGGPALNLFETVIITIDIDYI